MFAQAVWSGLIITAFGSTTVSVDVTGDFIIRCFVLLVWSRGKQKGRIETIEKDKKHKNTSGMGRPQDPVAS